MTSPIGKLVFAAGKKHALGIDAETGLVLWRTEIKRNAWSTSSFCTLALAGDYLYVVAGKFLNKLDAWTGDLLWATDVLGDLGPLPMILANPGDNHQLLAAAAAGAEQTQRAAAAT